MNENPVSIGIILLAAGSSSRMGRSKQLLTIDGQPLLRRTVTTALATNPHNLIVVLGSNFEEHEKVINDLSVEIVYNENWEKGMGSSIKKGLTEQLKINPETNAVLVLVCDQPLLTTDHLKDVIFTFQNSDVSIIATAYANTIGVPALFDKSLFKSLLNISDSQGAKSVIQNFISETKRILFPEAAVDLDTPDDFLKLKSVE